MKSEPLKATLLDREDLTESLAIFRFGLEGGIPDFEPGQFVTLGMPHPEKPGKTLWRAYSIASAPEQKDYLELYIRWARNPEPGKFTSWLWPQGVGSEVEAKSPRGPFTIGHEKGDGTPDRRRLVLMGGGTGVAPFMSYVDHLRAHGTDREIVVCHGASYVEELGYRERLLELERESEACGRDGWNMRYLATISRPTETPNAGWDGLTGRVESLVQAPEEGGLSAAEQACGEVFTPDNTSVYICGFGGTIESVRAVVEGRDFRTKREARDDGTYDIKFESYG